jgi:hypothetical protein
MFENITKKVVEQAKETVKEEASKKVSKAIPTIVGVTAVTVALFSLFEPIKSSISASHMTTINNFYIYIGGIKK